MRLFDFLFNSTKQEISQFNNIDREPIYDQSGSMTNDTAKTATNPDDDYLYRLNGLKTPVGSLVRNTQYVDSSFRTYGDSSFRTYGNYDSSNFQLILNVSRLWYKNNIPNPDRILNDFQHSYYAMATPGHYGGLSKIIVDGDDIKGYNETEINGCIVNLSIEKIGVGGFNIRVNNDISINRKVYLSIYRGNNSLGGQVDQRGLSKIPHSFNIKIDRRDVRISDLSQIYNALEKIAGWIKEEVENNFKEEAHIYKKRLYTSEILSNYRKNITFGCIEDFLVHINDILGNPSFSNSQDVFCISYAYGSISDTDGFMRLDKKMSDALYEISEFTSRIKSIYEKVIVDIKIVSGNIKINIRPDTTVDGDNLAWVDYIYTGPIFDIQTPITPITGTSSGYNNDSRYFN